MTNATPKVSVIIPIYNTAPYLRACLDSICQQTLRDIEILLVDDGSTDECPLIIEEHARKDNRIRHWRQFNQGQSVARNVAIMAARGEYVYFMDSDDLLESEALEDCYNRCTSQQLDFVCFDADNMNDADSTFSPCYQRADYIDASCIWVGLQFMNHLLDQHIWQVSTCLTFVRLSYLRSFFPGFPAGIIHEDNLYMVLLCLHAQRVGYIPHCYFKRRIRPHSTMTTNFGMRNIEGYTTVCCKLEQVARIHPEWRNTIDRFNRVTWNAIAWQTSNMTLCEKIECFYRLRRLYLTRYISLKNWIRFWIKIK